MVKEEVVGRLRQDGHMEIAWQHVGAAKGEVVMLSRLEECWVLGSGGGRRRSEECCLGGGG